MIKVKTITLRFYQAAASNSSWYTVEKVTDSTEYNPGQSLAKANVDTLCKSKAWKVIIKG